MSNNLHSLKQIPIQPEKQSEVMDLLRFCVAGIIKSSFESIDSVRGSIKFSYNIMNGAYKLYSDEFARRMEDIEEEGQYLTVVRSSLKLNQLCKGENEVVRELNLDVRSASSDYSMDVSKMVTGIMYNFLAEYHKLTKTTNQTPKQLVESTMQLVDKLDLRIDDNLARC
jgi:hypothetical protein